MSDHTNELMERCQAAWRRAQEASRHLDEDFQVIYVPADVDEPGTWWAGFYSNGEASKHQASGETIDQALEQWLSEYEHWPWGVA